MRTRRPCRIRAATKCCPIKPLPPVTSVRIAVVNQNQRNHCSVGHATSDKMAARSGRNPSATKNLATINIGLMSMCVGLSSNAGRRCSNNECLVSVAVVRR